VLSRLHSKGLLATVFDSTQLMSLRRELKQISELKNEYLNDELVDLAGFLENERGETAGRGNGEQANS
jgi:hypothetical protein